jgi:Nif-specific regulatory protein
VYAYLTILTGRHAGTHYPLDPARETLIGRGTDCHINLPDPLCSRVHASLSCESADRWIIRDHHSRNGVSVNGQKVLDAALADGHDLRIGSHDFVFRLSDEPATTDADDAALRQTIVQDLPLAVRQTSEEVLAALPTPEQVQELLLLYQLSIRLMGCEAPDDVIRIALELLKERTRAAMVGFLWVDDEGKLRPKLTLPREASAQNKLSDSLTELVLSQGHAVWVANQSTAAGASAGDHFADAVCAPLVHRDRQGERKTLGAIHVYLEAGRFRQSDFDFIIAVATQVVIALVRARQHNSLQTNFERLRRQSPGYDELIGESKPMQALKNKIQRVSRAPGCVLVRGESGAGKELVARAIHRSSPRADRPMVSVNCAAIPADLMESQLFGHKAGSFTGADRDHRGYFQQADLGTLFLDEVGELTLEGQAKLLRILEGHPFLPVGATQEVSVDVRVIAATNQDLQHYVAERKFREDLYYRLSVFELQIPPLREREGDVELLVDFFLEYFRGERGRPHLHMSPAARAKLLAYRWPGNVRQLRNVIDSAVVLADGDVIEPHDLGLRDGGSQMLDTLNIESWERRLIAEALQRAGGSVPDAARLLGIGRATLYRKIETYGIAR